MTRSRNPLRGLRLLVAVGRGGVEPPTFHFSGGRSYQLSYLPAPVPGDPETVRNSTGWPRR